MKNYYSIATKGFYRDDIHGSNIPEVAIEISLSEKQKLRDKQQAQPIILKNGKLTKVVIE